MYVTIPSRCPDLMNISNYQMRSYPSLSLCNFKENSTHEIDRKLYSMKLLYNFLKVYICYSDYTYCYDERL